MSSFTNWQPGQPNGLGTQLCVEMDGFFQPGLWNDANCHGTKSYICEKEEGWRKKLLILFEKNCLFYMTISS